MRLLDDAHFGVITAVMSLIHGVCSHSTEGFESLPDKLVKLMHRLLWNKDKKSPWRYYMTLCPWLQIKTLRTLQLFDSIPSPDLLDPVLTHILTKTGLRAHTHTSLTFHSFIMQSGPITFTRTQPISLSCLKRSVYRSIMPFVVNNECLHHRLPCSPNSSLLRLHLRAMRRLLAQSASQRMQRQRRIGPIIQTSSISQWICSSNCCLPFLHLHQK